MKPLDTGLQNGLAVFYLLVALMNLGFAAYYFYGPKKKGLAAVWAAVAGVFLIHSIGYVAHLGWTLSHSVRESVDKLMGPVIYSTLSVIFFVLLYVFRRFFTNPQVAWALLNFSLLFGGWAMTDPNFREIVAKEDNVPISMLIFSVGFFTWLSLYRAVQNDERLAKGEPVMEKV